MAPSKNKLYTNLLRITYPFLGPSTERFIDRQIINHLGIKPDQIKNDDLAELVDWIKLSISLLTDDERAISQYIHSIESFINK